MEWLVYANAVFSVFTEGTYPIRPFLFIAFLMLLGGALFAAQKGIVLPGRFTRAAKVATITAFGFLFFGNLVLQSVILEQHDIPQAEPTFFIDSGGITGTRLTHDHIGKAMIGASVGNLFSTADTGASVLAFMPPWVVPLESFFFLVALFGSVALFPFLSPPNGKGSRTAFFVLYGLTAFIVLAKSVDGGLLSDAAFLSFAVYGVILFFPPHGFSRRFWYGVIAYAWVVMIFYELGAYRSSDYLLDSVEKTFLYGAVAVALSLLVTGIRRRVGWVLLVIALVLVTAKAYPEIDSWHSYVTSRIGPDQAYAVSATPLPNLASVGSLGALTWYDLHPAAGVPVGAFITVHRLPLWWRPVGQSGTSCKSPQYVDTVRFTLLAPDSVSATSFSVGGIAQFQLSTAGEDRLGWKRYEGFLVLNPCVPEPNEAIQQLVLATGAEQAIMFHRDIRREFSR